VHKFNLVLKQTEIKPLIPQFPLNAAVPMKSAFCQFHQNAEFELLLLGKGRHFSMFFNLWPKRMRTFRAIGSNKSILSEFY
jgi:hypothetical protein